VKNIPTPVHAYMVAMRREDGSYSMPKVKKPPTKAAHAAPAWMWPLVVLVVCLVAIGVAGFLYFTKLELLVSAPKQTLAASNDAAPAPSPPAKPSPSPAPTSANAAPPPSVPSGEKFAPENVPFVGDRLRSSLTNEYVAGADYKALALNSVGSQGYVIGRPDEEDAKNAALELCQRRANGMPAGRSCELYAVGNTVVYPHGKPPVPPTPWIRHDPSTERPFATKDLPLIRDVGKAKLENVFVPGRKPRAIAVGPGGQFAFFINGESIEDSARRSLESCGVVAGVPCMIVAADDAFVVQVPNIMRPVGFFHASSSPSIAADARDDTARKLAEAPSGWNAVAVGTAGRPGLGLKANSEQNAINDALGNCIKRDSDCHVIAIGPFAVGPN
jgi:adenylate cyclase